MSEVETIISYSAHVPVEVDKSSCTALVLFIKETAADGNMTEVTRDPGLTKELTDRVRPSPTSNSSPAPWPTPQPLPHPQRLQLSQQTPKGDQQPLNHFYRQPVSSHKSSSQSLKYPGSGIRTFSWPSDNPTAKLKPKHQRTRRCSNTPCRRRAKTNRGPPPSMVTQGFYATIAPTSSWIVEHSIIGPSDPDDVLTFDQPKCASLTTPSTRRISIQLPHFRTINDLSLPITTNHTMVTSSSEWAQGSDSMDQSQGSEQNEQPDELASDESDLFLRAAKEEEIARPTSVVHTKSPMPNRWSRIAYAPLPPHTTPQGLEQDSHSLQRTPSKSYTLRSDPSTSLVSTDKSMRREGFNKICPNQPTSRKNPSTPINNSRDSSPRESFLPQADRRSSIQSISQYRSTSRSSGADKSVQHTIGGRRPSIPDLKSPPRSGYRLPNGLYSTSRMYNSSPLVPRTMEMACLQEHARKPEDTESLASTAAQSTVWDELEELKSRIHRLEMTGKIAPNSGTGTATSHASSERPRTATTTVTTMSISPKWERNNSQALTESVPPTSSNEVYPLLKSALTKSKPILMPEIYKALEASTFDAISIVSMMGNSGQPGPISNAQTSGHGTAGVTDRQVRRKAESLCRSLTELCLALCEKPPESTSLTSDATKQEDESRKAIQSTTSTTPYTSTQMKPHQSSPQTLSRLGARRSSLLTPSLHSTRMVLPDSRTSPQGAMSSRLSSLVVRTPQAVDEDVDYCHRAPSRGFSELNMGAAREKPYHSACAEAPRLMQSSLPVRRHLTSASLSRAATITGFDGRPPTVSTTSERDQGAHGMMGRLIEAREKQTMSLGRAVDFEAPGKRRRARHVSGSSFSSIGQASIGYT